MYNRRTSAIKSCTLFYDIVAYLLPFVIILLACDQRVAEDGRPLQKPRKTSGCNHPETIQSEAFLVNLNMNMYLFFILYFSLFMIFLS